LDSFLDQHCYECHDEDSGKGDLDLTAVPFALNNLKNREIWERVFDRVYEGEMPPKKKPQPKPAQKTAFIKALGTPLIKADDAFKEKTGRVNVRRLTRREYEFTMHELLGIDVPLQNLLPEDQVTHSFETVASGQQLSHFLLKSYLDAADIALEDAFRRALKNDKPWEKTYTPKDLTHKPKNSGNYRGPELRDGQSIAWPLRVEFYGRMPQTQVPASGWYRITLKNVQAINPKNGVVWGTLKSGVCYSNAPLMYNIGLIEATAQKRDLTYEAFIQVNHMLELKPNDATLKIASNAGRGGNVSYQGKDHRKAGIAGISVSAIHMERIHPNGNSAVVRRNLFGNLNKDAFKSAKSEQKAEMIRKAIEQFAFRAFRRPVNAVQLQPYVKLAQDAMAEPETTPVDALRIAYRAILCSPRFLTLIEKQGELDDYAVASRLSYMMWNSMPDDELMKLAIVGKLKDPKILSAQVDRMLDDERSDRFVKSFTDQWLNLRDIAFTTPDRKMFGSFDGIVQESMVAETRGFIREMLKHDLSITNLVDSDFAMLNERLKRHYRLDDVKLKSGKGLQKVSFNTKKRGGVVTHGSVLKITANGTTTSPVVRGVWVAERILGIHIPPPPANVPAVEPDVRGAKSIRDQLAKHSSSESCVACHQKIDPAGFALEAFDPVGLPRSKYGRHKRSPMVDPSGLTPDGEPFKNIDEWKAIYVKKPEMLARGFTKHLITYATGAAPSFSDRTDVYKIAKSAKPQHYGMRTLLRNAVASDLFLTK
jgi:hypothetical protein